MRTSWFEPSAARQIALQVRPAERVQRFIKHIENQLEFRFPGRGITFHPLPSNPPRFGKLALIEKIKAMKRMKQNEGTNAPLSTPPTSTA